MAKVYPTLENISRLKVKATEGELYLLNYLIEELDDSFEVFFNPFLDGDRPDLIILKKDVAIFVIEVKDYDLSSYSLDEFNNWEVISEQGKRRIASPQAQVFTYKKNLYNLHLPVLGLANLENSNFYDLVVPLVYFHKADKLKLNYFYKNAEDKISYKTKELFQLLKARKITQDEYNRKADSFAKVKRKISRDKSLAFTNDRLKDLVKKIKSYGNHVLFDERIYDDFKRRLMPSQHVLNQGKKIPLDKKQHGLVVSKSEYSKIKGVAGCGKTSILATRAVNAHKRHNSLVLIITFNITLKNLIKDKISDILGFRDKDNFAVTNYHQFFNSQLNAIGKDIVSLIDEYGLEELYKSDIFKDEELERYQTILVDEVQDFENEWVKILKDNFLAENGEMVLFGDYSQNIYHRDKRAAVIARIFGSWNDLKKSYRTQVDSHLKPLFNKFQTAFLLEKYSESLVFEEEFSQSELAFELIRYHECTSDWELEVFNCVRAYIRMYNLHPNDIVVISSNVYLVRKLAKKFSDIEKVTCMFESYHELYNITRKYFTDISLDKLLLMSEKELMDSLENHPLAKNEIKNNRTAKKNHFYANSGLIKFSTVHSYKGLESQTVFYIMDSKDSAEIIYTAITRTFENLIIFDKSNGGQFSEFFKKEIGITANDS